MERSERETREKKVNRVDESQLGTTLEREASSNEGMLDLGISTAA